ncbi:hypothetical protein Aph01nite_56950 [Acrocarpospora phusangensis]|uniref:Lipoprotein n=1 Tax=Acrocarpospora phusangensis TaxID=1070424 RepID=A0A919QJB3_9ACTN|nr:hypothetical protein [Acrocarpospora phusangensis]GIH27385.1 hypothetical protein Aph01nite_56950 [Acrocarpospora phusangensis]
MRTLPPALPALLLALLLAGCSTPVTGPPAAAPSAPRTDLPAECSEVPMLIGAKLTEFSSLAGKAKELKTSIGAAATDVEAKAATIGDATVKQAVQDYAGELKKIEVTGSTAVDAAQIAIKGGTDTMQKVADACA